MISVRRVTSDAWQEWRLLRRQALGEAPYAFGSTLAEWSGAGDCEQRWRQRLDAVPVNLVADRDGSPVGMLSVTAPAQGAAELISMWVAPSARGCGVGDALLRAAVEHAIRVYRRAGFSDSGWATSPDDARPERRMELDLQRHAVPGRSRRPDSEGQGRRPFP